MRVTESSRWGREHLVDLERSEQIYLVIRDHDNQKQILATTLAF
jgi:hypothetical protein